MTVVVSLVVILIGLSSLHVYWGVGGSWGLSAVIPRVPGQDMPRPGPLACFVVAALLACASAVVAARGGLLGLRGPEWLWAAACGAVAFAFSLRTIGDFNLFGLFRRVKDTAFARNDTWLYTPLCFLLALGCVGVALGTFGAGD